MATRFYMPRSGAAPVSPPYDANWEVTSGASRFALLRKTRLSVLSAISTYGTSLPITATQDVLACQFVSEVLPAQLITGTVSLVVKTQEVATTDNGTLAVNIWVCSQDGSVNRGTLLGVFGTDTEYPLAASAATRIVNAQTVTNVTTQPGDRLVVEVGSRATAPSPSGSAAHYFGNDAGSDYALTSGLTTALNPWVEFSQNLWASDFNNYQFAKAGNGMSVSERIR